MINFPNLSRFLWVRSRLHYTWLVAIIFMAAAVTTQFSVAYPLWQRITLGIAGSLLFFMAIAIREFVLIFTATSKGITVRRVTLFVFGGVSQIAKDTTRPSLEVLLAVIGMLCNLIIAGIFYVLYVILANDGNIIVDVLVQWLAFIFFMLTLFHFTPGFPMDGGRLLRAFLWKATDNYEQVTRIASWIGWSFGLLFIIGGILVVIITRQWFVGILLAFPGVVLQNAATHSRREAGY
ncbi:MAG: hypothetical protein ACETVS_00520 [Dehalococcoidales bacterium]